MKFLNSAFKVHLLELCSRVCTIFRDYNEVFNRRIPRYVHWKCSYCMKIIISQGRYSGKKWTFCSAYSGTFNKNSQGGITRYQYSVGV